MIKHSNYERIYTGSAINVNYLKGMLEEEGIYGLVRDDHESAVRGGFNGGYTDQVLLFVEKEHLMLAKRIAEKAFEDHTVPDEILEEQAAESRLAEERKVQTSTNRPLIDKNAPKKRSMFNILLNVALILYSAWRLSPLLQGQQLPTWRIALSAFILVFCAVALVNTFRK